MTFIKRVRVSTFVLMGSIASSSVLEAAEELSASGPLDVSSVSSMATKVSAPLSALTDEELAWKMLADLEESDDD